MAPLIPVRWLASSLSLLVVLLPAEDVRAQSYSASDSVFSTSDWSLTIVGSSPSKTASASQVLNGFSAGSNARQTSLMPGGNGVDTWAASIYENFYYDPSLHPGSPSVTLAFDSRWIATDHSRVGPAVRQGSSIWFGANPLNSPAWQTYSFTGWTSIAGVSGPDFSSTGARIYFGFYQYNGGISTFESQFANFSVALTAPVVPVPPAFVSVVVSLRLMRCRHRAAGLCLKDREV
jgi:hypothetical protein